MADPTPALGLLYTIVTGIYNGIQGHRIGKTDLYLYLATYKTYISNGENQMIAQGLLHHHDPCYTQAARLLALHSAIATWFRRNGFRRVLTTNMELPHWFVSKRADSFKAMVELVAQNRNRLRDELDRAMQAGGGFTFAAAGPGAAVHNDPTEANNYINNIQTLAQAMQ